MMCGSSGRMFRTDRSDGDRRAKRERTTLRLQEITLDERTWTLYEDKILGEGGFGRVYAGLSPDGKLVAVKLVPVGPQADREQLVAPGLSGRKNVLPILAHGEWRDRYVLAMPRASRSLRDLLDDADGNRLPLADATPILRDILSALEAIGGPSAREPVVHRDLKPANILEHDDEWCVADFGIAKYADATTRTNTAKRAHTAPYTSPEQWRGDRVEPRTDIYAWAVMALEMLTGQLPFRGPSEEDFKEQHLTAEPPALTEMPDSLAALLRRCLAKQPAARPTAAEALERLAIVNEVPSTPILRGLDRIERQEVERRTREEAEEAQANALREYRAALASAAADELDGVCSLLWHTLKQRMPSIVEDPVRLSEVSNRPATLIGHSDVEVCLWPSQPVDAIEWQNVRRSFDVIAISAIILAVPGKSVGQTGSEYELWYCNPSGDDHYRWYEMAWSFAGKRDNTVAWQDPKALALRDSYKLLIGEDVPWGISMPLTVVDGTEFVERWCNIIIDAFQGQIHQHWATRSDRVRKLFSLVDGER